MFARGVGGEDGFPCERFPAGYTPQVHRQRGKVEHAVGIDGRKGGSIPLQLPRAKVGKQLHLDRRGASPGRLEQKAETIRPAPGEARHDDLAPHGIALDLEKSGDPVRVGGDECCQ
jgi:hypothetical protein